jgi:hypothetical protein
MAEDKKKVYDYNIDSVRNTLVRGFRNSRLESTIADLAGLTGLPLSQIEAELPAVADEYGARLRVTEKGEILYSFPDGMKSRYRGLGPSLKKFWKKFKLGAAVVSKAVFKVWIMVMLVGYFILFLALALFAMVASMAVQSGGGGRDRGDRRGGGGLGGLWLTTRLLDSVVQLWFYSELFKDPDTRYRQAMERRQRRPLNRAIFSHVFGDGDPNVGWHEIEKKAFVAFLQTHKGVITLPEFMAITGLDPYDAEVAINRYMLEFEGIPDVTDRGGMYFYFPKLLVRVGTTNPVYGSTSQLKKTGKFSSNTTKMDRIFRLVNVFNLAFGGYFLYNAATVGKEFFVNTAKGIALKGGFPFIYSSTAYLFNGLGSTNVVGLIFWTLGITPLAFSFLFFLIPIVRTSRLTRENEKIKEENLRRIVYRNILDSKAIFRPESLSIQVEEAKPKNPRSLDRITDRLAMWSQADIRDAPLAAAGSSTTNQAGVSTYNNESNAMGTNGYVFSSIAMIQEEAQKVRDSLDSKSFSPGKTIFDSDS